MFIEMFPQNLIGGGKCQCPLKWRNFLISENLRKKAWREQKKET